MMSNLCKKISSSKISKSSPSKKISTSSKKSSKKTPCKDQEKQEQETTNSSKQAKYTKTEKENDSKNNKKQTAQPSVSQSSSSSATTSSASSYRLAADMEQFNKNFENLHLIQQATKQYYKKQVNEPENENAVAQSLFNTNNKNVETTAEVTTPIKTSVHEQEKESTEIVDQVIKIETSKAVASTEFEGRFADEPEYRMNHARRGVALIINNKRFDPKLEMNTRDGTDRDAAALELCFHKLGFDVKIAHNCTTLFMRDLLLKQARGDHSDEDCFVCVIMSHGDEGGVIYGIDGCIELDQLIQPFKFNRTLAGKPKLFFVQACRGNKLMDGIDSNPYDIQYVSRIPVEADFLIAYSTISGHFSWRNSINGSWFIQSLANILNEYGRSLELMSLLTRVNRRVAYHFESNTNDPDMSGKRQVPSVVSMLTKEVYFKSKNKNYSNF